MPLRITRDNNTKVMALYKLSDWLVKTVYIIPEKVNKTKECKSKMISGKKKTKML